MWNCRGSNKWHYERAGHASGAPQYGFGLCGIDLWLKNPQRQQRVTKRTLAKKCETCDRMFKKGIR
jgi:hypothetical protein